MEKHMQTTGISQKIRNYIKQNHISTGQIAEDLHISEKKLLPESNDRFLADEFLQLCAYLDVRPETL